MRAFKKLTANDRGVATIEYSLLAGFIALGVVTSLEQLGATVAESLADTHASYMDAATSAPAAPADPGDPGKGKGKDKPPKK